MVVLRRQRAALGDADLIAAHSAATDAAAWQEAIKSEGTAGAGEVFAGVERAKMAIERSIKENIAQGLAKISDQNL